jgi:hypothetical protein
VVKGRFAKKTIFCILNINRILYEPKAEKKERKDEQK